MKFLETVSLIEASPDIIWVILTDAPRYSAWNSGIIHLKGHVELGQKIRLFSKAKSGHELRVKVVDLIPNQKMVWTTRGFLGLSKCVRTFILASQGKGTTKFIVHEAYSGLFLPLRWRYISKAGSSFQQFVQGLKVRAESGNAINQ